MKTPPCTCSTASPKRAPWRRRRGPQHDVTCALYRAEEAS